MEKRALSLFRDMLAHAEDAISFMGDAGTDALRRDRMRQFAIIRAVEVIGEAASRIPPEERQAYPDLPWKAMIGMRNVLIHGYADLRLDLIVDTVRQDIPPLIQTLRTILETDR